MKKNSMKDGSTKSPSVVVKIEMKVFAATATKIERTSINKRPFHFLERKQYSIGGLKS